MAAKQPNILVIWGDDMGYWNLRAYSRGMMGYQTPNIDRIANEGMLFTDCYGEQSCTAGRSALITGQSVFRTGLSKVGLPGATAGMRAEEPGFDEFFGNLYHLNAEEEPELRDYPPEKNFPNFKKNFGPRGVLQCWADGKGGQKIENTGPLTKKRMETIDDETGTAARGFIDRAHQAGTPFFVWYNTRHMHFRTHAKPGSLGQSGRWQSCRHTAA